MRAGRKREIEHYLKTGDSDPSHAAWDGGVLRAARRRSSRAEG